MSVYVGNTNFREVESVELPNPEGFDTLQVKRKGHRDDLEAEKQRYSRGDAAPGYASMYLFAVTCRDVGNFAVMDITYRGNLDGLLVDGGFVKTTDTIAEQTTALTTTTGESVQFQYFAQQTTTRWLHLGETAPSSPKFPIVLDSTIGVLNLFNPFPANFTGDVDFKQSGRLNPFTRETLAKGVWGVTETWSQRIEPQVPIVKVAS